MASDKDENDVLISRRVFIGGGAAMAAGLVLPWPSAAGEPDATLAKAISSSNTVYISPLLSNGKESQCHGEVWFVPDDRDLLVVTTPDRWRAVAIGVGHDQARLWVGDYGLWKKSQGRFREAPTTDATARFEFDKTVHARALVSFGDKYTAEWGKWGPRFKDGLASGERVLIRYAPKAK
jgi:hypothetical protein